MRCIMNEDTEVNESAGMKGNHGMAVHALAFIKYFYIHWPISKKWL